MARPYRDGVELAVEPVPDARSPVTPADAVIVVGMAYPGSRSTPPAPLVLIPGYEYRIRSFIAPQDRPDGRVWILERRAVGDRVTVSVPPPDPDETQPNG